MSNKKFNDKIVKFCEKKMLYNFIIILFKIFICIIMSFNFFF